MCTHMSVFATPALDDWPGELEVGELGRWGEGKELVKTRDYIVSSLYLKEFWHLSSKCEYSGPVKLAP